MDSMGSGETVLCGADMGESVRLDEMGVKSGCFYCRFLLP